MTDKTKPMYKVVKNGDVATVTEVDDNRFLSGTDITEDVFKKVADYTSNYIADRTTDAAKNAVKIINDDDTITNVRTTHAFGVIPGGKIETETSKYVDDSKDDKKPVVTVTHTTVVETPVTSVDKGTMSKIRGFIVTELNK